MTRLRLVCPVMLHVYILMAKIETDVIIKVRGSNWKSWNEKVFIA